MAERLARLAWSLATWMSELFWRASSMARFRVRETAEGVVDWGGSGVCCACALKVTVDSSVTRKKQREKSRLELGRVLAVMLGPCDSFILKSGGKTAALQTIRNVGILLVASGRRCWPASNQKRVRWNKKRQTRLSRLNRKSE